MSAVQGAEATVPPPLDSWQVAAMRVTGFTSEPITREASWWADLVGYPPDVVASRPKVGQFQAEGEFEGRRLALNVQPDRVDWSLAPVVKRPDNEPSTLPLAGSFPEVLASFMKIAGRWVPLSPPLTRLAFGAVLAQPTEDRRTGYVQVAKYLPAVVLDPDGSSDFLYQINRPRPSRAAVQNLRINRLTKWSVLLVQRFSMRFEQTGITTVGLVPGDSACRLELDINTVPDFEGVLPQARLADVLEELVDLAREIAARGDVP